jgi:hypothetical protein
MLAQFLDREMANLYLWGEAAIPQFLSYYWFAGATRASSSHELILHAMLHMISNQQLIDQGQGLAQPYYDYEDVARHELSPILGNDQDPLRTEYSGLMSYFAESLMHLLVRTGRKVGCRSIWPDLTKIRFISFIPDSKWRYCLWRTERGNYVDVQPPLTKNWEELVAEARRIDSPEVPEPLIQNKFLHILFLILMPYRAIPSAVRGLARRFDERWFIPSPTDNGTST